MATYTINYLTGDTETVTADGVEYDPTASDYTFLSEDKVVALAPAANVRSIHRAGDNKREYPYEDGNLIVLGPDTFTDRSREAISHNGVSYRRQLGPQLQYGAI